MRMNVFQKVLLCALSACLIAASLIPACANHAEVMLDAAPILHNEKFGGFYVDISIADFNALGFRYGDSVDILLSNGKTLTDVPYYNGYYTRTNEPLICAYPGYARIDVTLNNGPDLYETLELDESTTCVIRLRESAKYLAIQEAMDTVYLNEREAFASDAIFANFRALRGGSLQEGLFFRSASPVDNQYNRASCVNALVEQNGIALILDLADSDAEFLGYRNSEDFCSDYTAALYDSGDVILLDMSAGYRTDAYHQKVAEGMRAVLAKEGPYLIHCTEGKDRTGFVAILIEALCGASYEELLADYMITYDNYYGIREDTAPEQYDAIVDIKFQDMVLYLAGVDSPDDLESESIHSGAVSYLLSAGMSSEEVTALQTRLTGK